MKHTSLLPAPNRHPIILDIATSFEKLSMWPICETSPCKVIVCPLPAFCPRSRHAPDKQLNVTLTWVIPSPICTRKLGGFSSPAPQIWRTKNREWRPLCWLTIHGRKVMVYFSLFLHRGDPHFLSSERREWEFPLWKVPTIQVTSANKWGLDPQGAG